MLVYYSFIFEERSFTFLLVGSSSAQVREVGLRATVLGLRKLRREDLEEGAITIGRGRTFWVMFLRMGLDLRWVYFSHYFFHFSILLSQIINSFKQLYALKFQIYLIITVSQHLLYLQSLTSINILNIPSYKQRLLLLHLSQCLLALSNIPLH